jgi:myosin heavy subunit
MNSEKRNWQEEKAEIKRKILDSQNEHKAIEERLLRARAEQEKVDDELQKTISLFELQKLKNNELSSEHERIAEQIKNDRSQHEVIDKEWNDKLNRQVQKFEEQQVEHEARLAHLRKEWDQMQDKLTQLSEVESNFEQANEKLENVQKELQSKNLELEHKNSQVIEATRNVDRSEKDLSENKNKLELVKEELSSIKKTLTDLEEKKNNLSHYIEGERSAALQETYKHKARVEKEISHLKEVASQKIEEEKRRTDEFCIKLKQDAQNEQNRVIAEANKQVEIIHSSRSQEIVKRERVLLDNEAALAKKEEMVLRKIQNRDSESVKKAQEILKNAQTQADQKNAQIETEINQMRQTVQHELDQMKADAKSVLEEQRVAQEREFKERNKAQKEEIDERKQQLKAEVDSLADKLVEEGNVFKAGIEKQFKSQVGIMAADVADSTAHLMNTILKEKLGMKVNTLELRKYKDQVSKIVVGVVNPTEKPSEVQVMLRNARVPDAVKKYWIKVIAAVAIGVGITMVFHLNKGLLPAIKAKMNSVFGANNAASDIFVKKIQEARRNKPKFNPQKTPSFKYGYLDNVLYTTGYLEVISDPKYYQKWVDSLNKLLLDKMELPDQAVVSIVTAESNMHLKLINAASSIRLENVEKDLIAATELEREHLEKIQRVLKKPTNFQEFMAFRSKFYKEFVTK